MKRFAVPLIVAAISACVSDSISGVLVQFGESVALDLERQ